MSPDCCVNYGKLYMCKNKWNENETKNAHAMSNFPLIDKCETRHICTIIEHIPYACDYHLNYKLCVFSIYDRHEDRVQCIYITESNGKKAAKKQIFLKSV